MTAFWQFESLKEDLTCVICANYFNNPILLHCGHSFCKDCVRSYWEEVHTAKTCPICEKIIQNGEFLYNRRLQNLAVIGKLLRPHILQSVRDMTSCDKHGKEVSLFCEDDNIPLCGSCFLTPAHKDHKVLPLEKAAGQRMEKLQETLTILRTKKEKFQNTLECEKMRKVQSEMEGQSLKKSVISEYEKMHQLLLEEEQFYLQNLDKEAMDELAIEERKASPSQKIVKLKMMLKEKVQSLKNALKDEKNEPQMKLECVKEKQAQCKLEVQTMKDLVMSDFGKKHQFLLKEEQLHLQRLDQEVRDNLEKFEESNARLSQHIHNLKMLMSEVEENFEKTQIKMLQNTKETLERNEELFLQDPVAASPRWSKCIIPGMTEMLMTFYRDITLDPETANPHLILPCDLKSVKYDCVPQDVPDNPERFDFALTVLAAQSFTSGKHYWEIEIGDKTEWEVGICKESIRRKGNVSRLPGDVYTLTGFRVGNDFFLCNSYHDICLRRSIDKLGIFLDYERGCIAFYNATDGSLIYSHPKVSFQEPLRPCFNLCFPNKKSIPGSLMICPRSNKQNEL